MLGERDGSTVHPQPPPLPPLFSWSPTSDVGLGTHACAVHCSVALHCASVLQATHLPLGTSHTFDAPASLPASPPPQSLSLVHPRQVWLV